MIGAVLILLAGAAALKGSTKGPPSSNRQQAHTSPSPGPAATPAAPASPSVAPAGGGTTFVIVMENRSFDEALRSPYIGSLAQSYAVATNYHSISTPSLPNYLAMTSGSTFGIADDSYRVLPGGGLGTQLTAADVSWRVYAEGFTGDCVGSRYPYAVKHNPFAFYGGACPSNVVAFSQLQPDLAGSTPRLAWIIPNLCNDGHDCTSATADRWLSEVVPSILASSAWRNSGALFLTWDEAESPSSNRVPLIVVAPTLIHSTSTAQYDHYSLLATIEDRLGVPRLGNAASANPITDLFR